MLEAVIPLVRSDLDRFRILERSIEAYLNIVSTCWVIVPDREYFELAKAIVGPRFVVLPESRIVPELAEASGVQGWYKQQLVKLAMAEHVRTEHYLLLDADVICARPVTRGDLFAGSRAICHRYPGRKHSRWYRWAERVLHIARSGWVHGVTPTLLSRTGVRSLAAYLNHLPPRPKRFWHKVTLPVRRSLGGLARSLPPPTEDGFASGHWRQVLLQSLPWTEYGLYFTFLEATEQFERLHIHSDCSLCGPSVWRWDSFDEWNPRAAAEFNRPFFVVQSIAGIPPELVAERVQRLFAA